MVFMQLQGLPKPFKSDLEVAGIPKIDDRGRTLDVHALHHSFGTLLSKGGVAPRTAQAAMRHSSIDLTMNTYTDPRLLDVAGAMNALPNLPLQDNPQHEAHRATGTADTRAHNDSSGPRQFAPAFAPNPGKPGANVTIPDKTAKDSLRNDSQVTSRAIDVMSTADNRKEPLSQRNSGSI